MPKARSSTDLIPPDFVMETYRRELPPELELPVRLLFSLRGCVQRVNADLYKWLGPNAVSPGRMQMLMVLWARPEPVLQRDLAVILGVSRASVSELLEALSRDGLVSVRPDETHGRRALVGLTETGRQVAGTQLRENALRLRETFASCDDDEKRALIGLLERLSPL